nr:MAG TPA: Cytochrome c oxidase subunit 1 [Caudoviricetes sp.]
MLLEMLMNPIISMGLIFVVVCLVVGFILSNMRK